MDSKQNNKEASIDKSHYTSKDYLKKERLFSYADQIEVVKKYADQNDQILEIGKGNGFVYNFLKEYFNYQINCVDINPALKADITDDIISPSTLNDKSYDLVTCFEVLEHMPFEASVKALNNMCAIARKYVILSIPDISCINIHGVFIECLDIGCQSPVIANITFIFFNFSI